MKTATGGLILTLTLGLLWAPLAAEAQVPRIGILEFGSPPDPYGEAFLQGLRERGYVPGKTIHLEYRWAEGRFDRLPDLAAELVRLKVDVITTVGTQTTDAAKDATSTIPIVMTAAGDPVGSGFVASLARPGGNITGLSLLASELSAKRLELLKEAVPTLSRVTVLWNSANLGMTLRFREVQNAARTLGLALQPRGVNDSRDFENALTAMTRERPQALLVMADVFTVANRRRIVNFTEISRVPAIYETRDFVDAGGLISYGPSIPDLVRRSATYVDKILKGAKPADLPVEQPTKFELVVNLRTAKALGLTIPQSILIRADERIE